MTGSSLENLDTAGPLRSGGAPRTILMRAGVGAAGHVVQRADLTSHRVVISDASLILVEEGRKRIRWSGGECIASAGEALSLQAGETVDIANSPGDSGIYRALWICWFPGMLAEGPHARRPVSPRVATHGAMGDAFRAAFYRAFDGLSESTREDASGVRRNGAADAWHLNGSGDPSMQVSTALPPGIATHRLQELLLWLAERDFHFSPPGPASPAQRVRRLVAADPSADWSMERVARETATSVPTLRRRLADEGTAFRDLVQDVRMSHALALLENTDTPVLHVALATGYASASRFAARFRARFGYLPTDIRGQNRGRADATLPLHVTSARL